MSEACGFRISDDALEMNHQGMKSLYRILGSALVGGATWHQAARVELLLAIGDLHNIP